MRQRENIRDKKRAAKLDIELDAILLQHYIDICQCPFCRNGITYKVLPLHIYKMHGVTAYQLRQDFGWNRHHKLCSYETSEKMSDRNKRNGASQRLLQSPNWGNLENRYKDGGQREEAIKSKRVIADRPEVKQRFANAMAKVDHRAIALGIPPETRSARSQQAAKTTKMRHGIDFFQHLGERAGKKSAESRTRMAPEILAARSRKAAQTIRLRYGAGFYQHIGERGGATTKQKYDGTNYYYTIGKKSGEIRKQRLIAQKSHIG